jgi:hypothetical protein
MAIAQAGAGVSEPIGLEGSGLKDPCRRLKDMAHRTFTSLSCTLRTKSW